MNWDFSKVIEAKEQIWINELCALIRIPSPFEQEHAVVEHVLTRLNEIGFEYALVPMVADRLKVLDGVQHPISKVAGRNNIVVTVKGEGVGRALAINCHLDIVGAGQTEKWSVDPFSATIDEEERIVIGRGAMDNKAGVAVALALAELLSLRPSRLSGDVIFHFVLEDETTGNGTLMCLDAGHTADAAIIVDGTRFSNGINQHAGNMRFGLALTGNPSSVSVSHLGANAAEMLARVLLDLKDMVHGWNNDLAKPWTMYPSPNQFVIQDLESRSNHMSVSDNARAISYMTFTPPKTITEARSDIKARVKSCLNAHDWPSDPVYDWSHIATDPCRTESELLESKVINHAKEVLGEEPVFNPSTGTSDMRHFSSLGIPSVLYGPGRGYNPHRVDEHYYVDDLATMVSILYRIADDWCS